MRTLTATLLLLLLPLAGCLSGTDDTSDPTSPAAGITWRAPLDLGSHAGILGGTVPAGAFGTNCQDALLTGDCGLGEPQVEVDSQGTIYVSGVCCLTVAPPVLVSRDGGETFQSLDTNPPVREQFGIEGDFAIDGVGRVYFADIEFAATFQVTVWDHEGEFLRHTKWPAPPIVDRDWIRAEGDGIAYYVYNTGGETNVYKTTDAGATWSLTPLYTAPYGLGNTAIWPHEELCLFGGNDDGFRRLDCTRDGGDTWQVERSTLPRGQGSYPVGAYDEAGNLHLANAVSEAIQAVWRSPDGAWSPNITISPPGGHHRMPWTAAGADGAAVVAWYGTPDDQLTSSSEWFLHVAYSTDATAAEPTWTVHIPDPEPVMTGNLARQLLDFFQIQVGPDGSIHVAYNKLGGSNNKPQLIYLRSDPAPELAQVEYFWGP